MRPERILSELRKAVPEDGFIVTDVGWNKNGVGQQFPITVPGTFITPSGLATMGFGPAAVLGVKMAQPDRAAVALDRRRRLRQQPVGGRDRDGSRACRRLAGDGQRRRSARSPASRTMHYGWSFGCLFERDGEPLPRRLRGDGASATAPTACCIESADELGPALREALASRPADGDSGADGKRADADARTLEHQRHLPEGQLAAGTNA